MRPQDLYEVGQRLEEAGFEYVESSKEFQQAEEEYKLLRAKILNLDRVANLPNQTMREAESDVILQNDDRFAPLYRKYLEAKARQKTAWIMFEVRKELNENARAIFNHFTYRKES